MSQNLRARLDIINEKIEFACKKANRDRSLVRLIAVTKTHPVETIQTLIDLGVKDIGENRVGEIIEKAPLLHGDYTLHMIGHLQTNKVTPILPYIKWIQSIDREKLVSRVEYLYRGTEKIKVLIEVNTSGEQTKSGCTPKDCRALCERVLHSNALELHGFMTIGPLGNDELTTRKAFSLLREISEKNSDLVKSPELSMGMSGDFEWAIDEGSTMVRVGTLLLGERD
jgi:pyridoxal phosphate enzyme (YggS family)